MNAIGTKVLPDGLVPLVHAGLDVLKAVEKGLKKRAELTLAEYSILEYLSIYGPELRMSALARMLDCQKSNMTQMVDRMQRKRLVIRRPESAQSRALFVSMTELGKLRYKKARRAWQFILIDAREAAAAHGYADLP
jgi:DNA-binding MarR family transcriptional regulator